MDTSNEDQICNNDFENFTFYDDAAEKISKTTSEDCTSLLPPVKSNNTNNHQEPNGFNSRIEEIVVQRDHLLQISFRREKEIERFKLVNQLLEQQLKSAVKAKSEALARLDLIEGKELNLSLKEKQIELDKDRFHTQVANLKDDLNKNENELMAVRQDYLYATSQLQINSTKNTEQQRLANSKICELTETNQMLKSQNEEYMFKLTEQINKSSELMAVYDKDLQAKVELVKLYKANCDDYQAHIKDLDSDVAQLKQLVNETADECGILETKLNNIDEKYQVKLDERDEIITKLRDELKHANILLGSDENASDYQIDTNSNKDVFDHLVLSDVDDIHLKKGVTMTEMFNKYCTVVKELHNKQKDYNELEMETKKLYEGVQESAKKFSLLQLDNKKLKAANEKFTEDKKELIVAKVVTRVKLEDTLMRCDFLEKEYKSLEMSNQYKFPEQNVNSDVQDSKGDSQYLLNDLKEQNQTLLQVVKELLSKIEEMEETETKSNLEIGELRDANEHLLANRWKASSTNVCHKSVGVSEYQLMIENDSSTNILSIITEKTNVTKIEEKLQSKRKELDELKQEYNAMQKENRDLIDEKINLSNELKSSNIRNNDCNNKILILEEQNKMFVNNISEQKIAIKCLTTENINFNQKLSAGESRCEQLHTDYRKLSDAKKSLDIEVEALRKELLQSKISIQVLEIKLKIAGENSKQLQTESQLKLEEKDKQMLLDRQNIQNEVDRCQKITADLTHNSMNHFSNNMEETETKNIEIENTGIENSDSITFVVTTMDDDSQTTFFKELQLEKSAEKEKRKSSSSNEAVSRKRSRNDENSSLSVSTNVYQMTTRSQKKPRVSFKTDTKRIGGVAPPFVVEIKQEQQEYDEHVEVNVWDDNYEDYKPTNSNVELELHKEIRTRSQAQFLRDALHSVIEESQEVPGVGKLRGRKIKSEHVVVDQQSSDPKRRDIPFEVRGDHYVTMRNQPTVRGRGRGRGVVRVSETSVRGRGRSSGLGRGRPSGRGRGGSARGSRGGSARGRRVGSARGRRGGSARGRRGRN